ncbi:GNAT family N-acetyltransferase [Mariniflexile sp. AS56]|uniref:GNAT family N-acetyltransferase n=1 Tax=Mariniflexile sp. AS56 TaxID=3063957 RepID=UPI0026ECA1F0|nr:GNAT family N-acetyltransferase [Mariniflexile sp. AS56]MDO7171886.1 GNAT family N-acetyltransferase [Mariniflexile sp. AS56]
MNYTIKHIAATDTYIVRHPVLRTGKPIESCVFDGDDLTTTYHLGIYHETKLVGICSFFKNNNQLISELAQYQLRGMAILNDYQGLGLGKLLLNHGETFLKEKHIKTIWCNAREHATHFYKKIGYQTTGKPFMIKDVGIHFMMHKNLHKLHL